jgi:acid phosphatase
MPSVGFAGCFSSSNLYARKHNPVVNWRDLPPDINLPFGAFPSDFSRLPTVSIVVPNQLNDMHDGRTPNDAIAQGDKWLKENLDSYIKWARSNNSLFILTWDEDDDSSNNRIATIFLGPMVKPGRYKNHIDHYNVLRTIVEMYGLSPLGASANADPITEVWREKK